MDAKKDEEHFRITRIIEEVISEERSKEKPTIKDDLPSKGKEEKKDYSNVDKSDIVVIFYKGSLGIYKLSILPLKYSVKDYRKIPMSSFDEISNCIEKVWKKSLTDYVQFLDSNIIVNAMGTATYDYTGSDGVGEALKKSVGMMEESASYDGEIRLDISKEDIKK